MASTSSAITAHYGQPESGSPPGVYVELSGSHITPRRGVDNRIDRIALFLMKFF